MGYVEVSASLRFFNSFADHMQQRCLARSPDSMQAKVLPFSTSCHLIKRIKDLHQFFSSSVMVLRRENNIAILIRILHLPGLRFKSHHMDPGFFGLMLLFIDDILDAKCNIACFVKYISKSNRQSNTDL